MRKLESEVGKFVAYEKPIQNNTILPPPLLTYKVYEQLGTNRRVLLNWLLCSKELASISDEAFFIGVQIAENVM